MLNKSLKILFLILVTSSMTGCLTSPIVKTSPEINVPFPVLTLQDNPRDPLGFCLSKEDASELALYIQALQRSTR